jgi:hypothetical protein
LIPKVSDFPSTIPNQQKKLHCISLEYFLFPLNQQRLATPMAHETEKNDKETIRARDIQKISGQTPQIFVKPNGGGEVY